MLIFFGTLAAFIGTTICWLLLKMAPWSAPVSGLVGFLIFMGSLHADSYRGMGFGGGLFAFSALLFVLGGGLEGR